MPQSGYSGEVVYIYAYDVAYEMTRESIAQLLGRPVEQFTVDISKRAPRQLGFYRPQMVRLAPLEVPGGPGQAAVRIERTIKLYRVGAISVSLRVPFHVEHFEDLIPYHDLRVGQLSVHEEAGRLAQQALDEMRPNLLRPVPELRDEEAYTVFCLRSGNFGSEGLEDWLVEQGRSVAALLTQEPEGSKLSDQEAMESTQLALSYYERDLTVIDWDAAVLIDEEGSFEEIVHIMELANVQLSELETYDHILDEALERSYRDLSKTGFRRHTTRLAELREIRVDMARLSDELSNTTKFFGDWHLARVYQYLSTRFHLADWHREIDEKLKTLDSLYSILKQDQTNRWMMILEVLIVVLFIIDLVILVMVPTMGK